MNNRLAIQDLAGLLAEYTGKDKNSSERFLREFIAVVSEGVYTDKLVKVKGLGTFKIIPVEKREAGYSPGTAELYGNYPLPCGVPAGQGTAGAC